MNTIAIDLGGTKIKLGVVSDGKVIAKAKLDAHSSEGFSVVAPEIQKVCRQWKEEYPIHNMGIAFPSLVDVDRKQVLGHNSKFADCIGFDFEAWAQQYCGLSTVLENDANAAALGEQYFGAARGWDNFTLLILGTGIGTAAVMNGRLLRGKHYQAGNLLGHIPLTRNGRKCRGCPGIGCAEAQASTWALKEMAAESSLDSPLKEEPVLNFEILRKYYDAHDPLAKALFDECCDYWANCLITQVCAYDPELVVLSGGVLNWGPELPERLFRQVGERAWTPWGKLEFRVAQQPEESVLLGLHAMACGREGTGKI